jgi:hypothetical protein
MPYVEGLVRLTHWALIAWMLTLPFLYMQALRWARCKEHGWRLIVQLLAISLIPALISPIIVGLGISIVDSFNYLYDTIQGLQVSLVFCQSFAIGLTVGSLIAGLVTRATRGKPALVLTGLVAVWSMLLLSPFAIVLRILGNLAQKLYPQ